MTLAPIAIAAVARNRAIGFHGKIPWHIPDDLKFFKRTTLGHVVLMGRKTFESLPHPLPGRDNWVLSRTIEARGVTIFRRFEDIPPPPERRQLFVIGGSEIYAAFLPACHELLLTHVESSPDADAWFPSYEREFSEVETIEAGTGYRIVRYRRQLPTPQPSSSL